MGNSKKQIFYCHQFDESGGGGLATVSSDGTAWFSKGVQIGGNGQDDGSVELLPVVHNWLDNSDLTKPINQRNQSSYTSSGFYRCSIDRWGIIDGSGKVVVNPSGSASLSTVDVDDGIVLTQRINPDVSSYLKGRPYTLAYYNNSTTTPIVKVATGTFPTGSSNYDGPNFTLGDVHGNVYYSTSEGYVTVRIWIPTGVSATYSLGHIALYEGAYTKDTVPKYRHKGWETELSNCQYYYYNSIAGGRPFQIATMFDENGCLDISFPLPRSMRIIPTISFYRYEVSTENWTEGSALLYTYESSWQNITPFAGYYSNKGCAAMRYIDYSKSNAVCFVVTGYEASAEL